MGKTVRGPMGPIGPPGPPGPPADSSFSSYSEVCNQSPLSQNLDAGWAKPLACPISVLSHRLGEGEAALEAGSLIYLQDENKLVLKTSSQWVELQVSGI